VSSRLTDIDTQIEHFIQANRQLESRPSDDEAAQAQLARNADMLDQLEGDAIENKIILRAMYRYFHTAFAKSVFNKLDHDLAETVLDISLLLQGLLAIENSAYEDPLSDEAEGKQVTPELLEKEMGLRIKPNDKANDLATKPTKSLITQEVKRELAMTPMQHEERPSTQFAHEAEPLRYEQPQASAMSRLLGMVGLERPQAATGAGTGKKEEEEFKEQEEEGGRDKGGPSAPSPSSRSHPGEDYRAARSHSSSSAQSSIITALAVSDS